MGSNSFAISAIHKIDVAFWVSASYEAFTPADIQAVQHLPIFLVAYTLDPALRIEVEHCIVHPCLNVKHL